MHSRRLFIFCAVILLFMMSFLGEANSLNGRLSLSPEEKSWLRAHSVIRVGIMPKWPPLNYVDGTGHPRGIGVDYLSAINERLNGILTIVPKPFDQSLAAVKKKELDAMMDITPKKDRETWFNFTMPYIIIPHVLVGKKGGPYYKTERDLVGKSVALEKGFYNIRYFHKNYPGVKVKEYPNTSMALGAVARGEADAYAGNRAVAIHLIERELLTNLQVQGRLDKPPVVLSIGVRKDWPELAGILNRAMMSITISEERQIRHRWIDDPVSSLTPQTLPREIRFDGTRFVLKNILIVFSVILLAILLVWVAKGCPRSLSLRAILFGVSLVFTGMIVAICCFVLILLQLEKKLSAIEVQKYESLRLAYELKQSSDDLTRFARTFTATGEFRFEAYFSDIIAIRDGIKPHPGNQVPSYWDHVAANTMNLDESGEIYSIMERMEELGLSGREKAKLVQAKKDADALVKMETAAMNAAKGIFRDDKGTFNTVGEPNRHMARKILYGKKYLLEKSRIMKSIDDFYELLERRSRNELNLMQQRIQGVLMAVTVLTLVTILFSVFAFFMLKHRIILPLYRLKSGANILKEGDYTHHIDISSDDEAGDLARTFNAMADSISERTAKLRSIIETAIDAIIVTSQRGVIQEFSPAAEKIFGYGAEEVMGRNISILIAEPAKSRHDEYISHYLATGETKNLGKRFETEAVRKDGQAFPISISVSEAEIGGKRQFTGIIRDITERKSVEEARQLSLKMTQMPDAESERTILEFGLEACVNLTQSNIGFLHFISRDQKIIELQIWSKNTREVCSVDKKQTHYPVDQAGIWADCLHKKTPVIHNNYEETSGRKGLPRGHVPMKRDMVVPIMDIEDRIVAVIGVGNKSQPYGQYDIDIVSILSANLWGIVRRKRSARRLRENEERLKLVLKGGNLGYWDVNLKTRETFVNERWAQMLGCRLEDVHNAYEVWKSCLHGEDREKVLQQGREYLNGKVPSYEVEYRAIILGKETRWHISRGAVVERDGSGRPLRMVGTVMDITEKKITEQELQQNMEDLKRFSNIVIGREEKMIKLKEEINGLLAEGGRAPRYKIVE